QDFNFDGLWVLGGPMHVWQVDRYPWLADEISFIKKAVIDHQIPFLGFCLGHQLLALALGGKIAPAKHLEIGFKDVTLNKTGQQSPFLNQLPLSLKWMQWHECEIIQMPLEGQNLAFSNLCHIQAMQWQKHAFSTQFHPEIDQDSLSHWLTIKDAKLILQRHLGVKALSDLQKNWKNLAHKSKKYARIVYKNWMDQVGKLKK
ncbi:MAG: type 1 glutamine amidotransferase, partial [Pseudomonadota bacterium]